MNPNCIICQKPLDDSGSGGGCFVIPFVQALGAEEIPHIRYFAHLKCVIKEVVEKELNNFSPSNTVIDKLIEKLRWRL